MILIQSREELLWFDPTSSWLLACACAGEAGVEGAAGHRAAAGAGAGAAGAEAAGRDAQPHGGAAKGAGASHGAEGALLCGRRG